MTTKHHKSKPKTKPTQTQSHLSHLPEGWRLASLSELLTVEQLDAVAKILNKHGGQPVSTCLPELRAYLITLRDSLEAKGILPEFLTYAIADAVAKGGTLCGDDCPSHSE